MILQNSLPHDVSLLSPLPGIRPLDPIEWLQADDAYGAQMDERARLLAQRRAEVLFVDPCAHSAVQEMLDQVLAALPQGFSHDGARVSRPDGVTTGIDRDDPMGTLGHLVQEDLCLMQKPAGADEHVLSAAVLCFPARWRLADKVMRPLTAIHAPVPEYESDVARRVQRLFDGIQVDRPLWRFNTLWDHDPTLFQPVKPAPRLDDASKTAPYFRTERQCLLRLPITRAVVFSIHTYVVPRAVVAALA